MQDRVCANLLTGTAGPYRPESLSNSPGAHTRRDPRHVRATRAAHLQPRPGVPFLPAHRLGYLPDDWRIETSVTDRLFGRPGGATQVQIFNQKGQVMSIERLVREGVLAPR